jgi:hypothetical protein
VAADGKVRPSSSLSWACSSAAGQRRRSTSMACRPWSSRSASFTGMATLVLIPRAEPQRRQRRAPETRPSQGGNALTRCDARSIMIAPVLHETPNGRDRRILRPLVTRPRASALLVSALVLVAAAAVTTAPARRRRNRLTRHHHRFRPRRSRRSLRRPSDDEPGVRVWQLPDAPDGSKPDQSWLAVGSGPDGSIYVSGHDHVLNSMLYRLDPGTGDLTWVGDARTASTAADSVLTRFRAASILRRIDELDGTGLARTSMTDLEIGCSRSSTTTQISTTSPPSPDNRPNGSSSAARSIDRPSRTDVNRVRGRVAVHH